MTNFQPLVGWVFLGDEPILPSIGWVVPPPSNSGNEGLGWDSLLKM